jgi:hypothetical protein
MNEDLNLQICSTRDLTLTNMISHNVSLSQIGLPICEMTNNSSLINPDNMLIEEMLELKKRELAA